MGTDKGWTPKKKAAWYQGYIAAEEDPRRGAGKKKEVFNGQVSKVYAASLLTMKENNPRVLYTDRTGDEIVKRYRKSRCECLTL